MNITLYGLISSTIITSSLLIYFILMKPKKQLTYMFIANSMLLLIWNVSLLLQFLFAEKYNINSIYFDYFTYIGICFIPISLLFSGIIFAKTKIIYKKIYLLLFIIPILSLLFLWTNNLHNLFYIHYSTALEEVVYGPWLYIHTIYSYILIIIGMIYLLIFSIKNSGFFSKQSLWIVIGTIIPLVINLLGSFKIISMSIYITPISFTFGVSCYAFAVFKFDFLKFSPIALQKIVDRMSDSYLVIDENNIITDFNETFLNIFHFRANDVRNKDFSKLLENTNIDIDELVLTLNRAKHSSETFTFEKYFESLHKYFNIEINNITNNGKFLGILILFKDITQHIEDMNIIRENQDLLVEKERLASLGQLVGGIAHNLKTPIMSIAGAAEGLSDLTKEYDTSIDDPDVTSTDHHDIARDMNQWIEKIKTHTSYMSDIITAVKGQAVTLSEDEQDNFTVEELIKRINILMRHELKNALIELNVHNDVDGDFILKGNVNSLVQVVNNLISNAIQAYNGKPNETIDLVIEKKSNSITISIKDYGCGMKQEVKDKLFKEMITTKGKNGTGLGLFMSYSTIRGHFNGNMTFESELDKGTSFHIILPL
ncbi:MAG: PAS domain S-box protein [Clostridia bacterium]|nr:PAS domain S-box protein [Clostridia bacterium]